MRIGSLYITMITLEILKEKVVNCTKCSELVANRTQTVFGEGNIHAKLMIIGECPGKNEDEQGRPFVGRAGDLLNNILNACGIQRENVYITNVGRCRPPANRTPTLEEVNNCQEHRDAIISLVNPKYILLLGSVASTTFLGMPISAIRGQLIHQNGRYLLSVYHPAFLLRNPAAKKDVWDDIQPLLELMKKEGDI
jgi:DNA polymerase